MRRYLLLTLLVSLFVSSLGIAEVNRDIWSDGGLDTLEDVTAWFADKRPDMLAEPMPDIQDELDESWWGDRADNYNAQMWGWVTIPEDGEYQWWMHADDQAALYVSTDDSWANVEEVAVVSGWMSTGNWTQVDGGGNNMSDFKAYTAGQKLAVWAVMTERGGGDNLGIGWIMPNQTDITYVTPYIAIDTTRAKPIAPATGATDVLRDEGILEWLAGEGANTHNVYLSTDFDAVNSGAPEALVAEGLPLAQTMYDPGRLAFDMTYYWRVDEVSAEPNLPVSPSKIASFTIEAEALALDSVAGATASSTDADNGPEKTIDGSGLTDGAHGTDLSTMWLTDMADVDGRWIQYDLGGVYSLHQMKVWNHNSQTEAFLGYGIKEALIEVSTDGETWTEFGTIEIPQASGTPDYMGSEIDVSGATGQYLKITALSNYSIVGLTQVGLSEVQLSYIPVKARDLNPADMTYTDDIDLTLSWRAGRLAAQHEVVFGADEQAVIDNNSVVAVTEELSYDLEGLDLGGTYYWKINEVNEAEIPAVHESDLMTLITPEDRAIDDMEMYKAEDGYYIWQSWADGFGHDDNGSVVGNGDLPETSVVYEGSQSLPMTYDNTSSPISEVTLGFDTPLDLTKGNPEDFKLQVRGDGPGVLLGDDTVTIGASGADIWGSADQFRYVYKALAGDGAISARIDNLDVVHNWAKAGVMIRGSLTASSEMAFVATTGVNGTRYQYRLEDGVNATSNDGAMDGIQQTLAASPVWVKIERVGDDLNGYYAQVETDPNSGEELDPNWVPMGENPVAVVMGEANVGLAVTSHDNNTYTTAVFSNVETTGAQGDWMEVHFGNHPNNDPAPMYVRLTDADGKEKVIDHADPEATGIASWNEMSIPLDDLGPVNPAAISAITVGVGGDDVMGKIWVDDIRTTRPYPKKITFVSFHGADDEPSGDAAEAGFTEASDKAYTELLKDMGYDVTRYITNNSPDAEILNAADLVIISRAVSSGHYSNDAATLWNSIESPMMILGGYVLRNSRMGFTTGGTMVDTTGDVTLTVNDPEHPIFAGVELLDGTMVNPFAEGAVVLPSDGVTASRGVSINNDPADDEGTVLAVISEASADTGPAGGLVIAEYPAGATLEHAGGAEADVLAGDRLIFLTGSREPSGVTSHTAGLYDLYDDGTLMFLNAVSYMAGE